KKSLNSIAVAEGNFFWRLTRYPFQLRPPAPLFLYFSSSSKPVAFSNRTLPLAGFPLLSGALLPIAKLSAVKPDNAYSITPLVHQKINTLNKPFLHSCPNESSHILYPKFL